MCPSRARTAAAGRPPPAQRSRPSNPPRTSFGLDRARRPEPSLIVQPLAVRPVNASGAGDDPARGCVPLGPALVAGAALPQPVGEGPIAAEHAVSPDDRRG